VCVLPFSREKVPQNGAKINWSVKTPMHRLDIGVARSGHLISVVLALKNYFFGLHRSFE